MTHCWSHERIGISRWRHLSVSSWRSRTTNTPGLSRLDPLNEDYTENTADVYTCVKWHENSVEWWQEINNQEIEGTRGVEEIDLAMAATADVAD